ncbi:hypothetical protein OS493_015683 [Desmophyllum pertusum]|uniref:Uncharacterized protein n=1 Tax=Desmophyllum pertusum TaxID=174260 RepID=A0A9W9YSC7_9CNID|nr:hypothetical protein OS493_015683 [Desmophyllum pertusum]
MWQRANFTVEKRRIKRISRVTWVCSLCCREMRRLLSHGRKLRVLLLLITISSVFLIAYQGDIVWLSDHGTRFPNYVPPEIIINNNDLNLGELVKPQKRSPSSAAY